jgi:hypothetical protein
VGQLYVRVHAAQAVTMCCLSLHNLRPGEGREIIDLFFALGT